MRQKDVSKWFENLLTAALAAAPDKDRPPIISAAYILKELCLDIKRLSEAAEEIQRLLMVMAQAEEEKLSLQVKSPPINRTYTWSRPTAPGIDDDIPF